MLFIAFLILFPFLTAAVLTATKNNTFRKVVVSVSGGMIIVAAIAFAVRYFGDEYAEGTQFLHDSLFTQMINYVMIGIEVFLMLVVVSMSIKHKKYHAAILSVIGTVAMMWLELSGRAAESGYNVYCDKLTVIMTLIIAVVGSFICIYAVGYMHDYHNHHKEYQDRRTFFFPMLFVFLGAMIGLVTSANLIWIYFYWEITSISSFLLIGYTKTEEATNNSFRALWMNLLGGLGFAGAIIYASIVLDTSNLQVLVSHDKAAVLIPVILLAFAAMTKSALLPFSKWLLGAMVAPTPTSALLHSATMVKAGVYLLIRLAPVMSETLAGNMVALVGGFTFLIASMLAITVSDGKKVLAYSTISNLGLIAACAGVGTTETVWAAVLLVMFHAVSKSMLFQTVGSIENATGSRDIEDMHGLVMSAPFFSFIMIVGIAGMFLAPFGMLISKWAALKAFIDADNIILILFIAFGSATTMLYWTKWLTKILVCKAHSHQVQHNTPVYVWVSLIAHAIMMICLCVSLPLLSIYAVEPLLLQIYNIAQVQVLAPEDLVIMVIMLIMIFIIPVMARVFTSRIKTRPNIEYMSGVNQGDDRHFEDSFGNSKNMYLSAWYLEDYFGEKKIWKPAAAVAVVLLVAFIGIAFGTVFGNIGGVL